MADISKSDIKLMASQVLADTEDGGGQMTSNEIVSGNVNNLFPDISRLDRTYGRVSMRKAYISVQTDNRATYYGSHVALTEQAKDPLVNTTLFTTKDWFDKRESCRNRIEGYLVKGPIYACALWGDHYAGSRAITVFTEEGWKLPENGEVFVLIKTKDLNGATVTREEQFLRITKIESEVREFDDGSNKYKKQIITINFGDKIKFDLLGSSPTRAFTYGVESRGTVIHTSVVADTSSYYGVSALKEPAVQGSLGIRVDEIRKPLVPSTTSQAAVTDFTVGGLIEAVISSSKEIQSKISIAVTSGENMVIAGMAITRGSLELNVSGVGSFTDNSKGDLLNTANAIVGTVSYSEGRITFNSHSFDAVTATITFKPAVAIPNFTESGSIAIKEQNRGFTYVFNCTPSPIPGTVKIDFLSSGKWYSLYDQGTGELKGLETGTGSGTVNFTTGSISITLGGMPDVNSDIIIYWGTRIFSMPLQDYLAIADELVIPADPEIPDDEPIVEDFPSVQFTGQLSSVGEGTEVEFVFPISSGTYKITGKVYANRKVNLNYTYVDSEGSSFFGKCGYVDDFTYSFTPRQLPENISEYTINYVSVAKEHEEISKVYSSTLNFTLSNSAEIAPNTFSITMRQHVAEIIPGETYPDFNGINSYNGSELYDPKNQASVVIKDNGSGSLIYEEKENPTTSTEVNVGTINYITGAVSITGDYNLFWECLRETSNHAQSYVPVKIPSKYKSNTPISCSWQVTTDNPSSTTPPNTNETQPADLPQRKLVIPKQESMTLQSGSVAFKYKDVWFFDNGMGELIGNNSQQVFSINYATGVLYPANDFMPFSILEPNLDDLRGVLIQNRKETVFKWVFRTPGAPVTPSSFTIQATTDDGQVIDATGDFDGIIESNEIHGTIEYSTGIVNVKFGVWTAIPEGQESAEWLNDFDVEGGNYLKPLAIQTSTIVMNCVVETYVPLNADLLGLSPVKLPLDGRVPIFRDGDIVLIHHSETDVISSPTAGQVVSLSRQNVNLIELYDNNGVYIPELGNYSVDLTAGEITFEDPLDLSAYSNPFQAVNRVEDMVLATDVQITGHMTLSQPLQHDYPADETSVSSVLAIGDVQARIYNVFTDSSWGNVWQDTRKYSPTAAQYDTVNYPLITKNKSSVKERFACVFTSSNTVNILGEHLGVILTNAPITSDIAPVNPATGEPYFTIRYEGWGAGWSSGQVLRFNSDAGNFPVWFCRTTQQGPATENSDNYVINIRGDSS